MCNSLKNQLVKDEFIYKLEKTLFEFYEQHEMTDSEIARLVEIQKQVVIKVRYED